MTTSLEEKVSPSESDSTTTSSPLVGERVGEQHLGLVDAAEDALLPGEDLHDHDGVEALPGQDLLGAPEVDVRGVAAQDVVRRSAPLPVHALPSGCASVARDRPAGASPSAARPAPAERSAGGGPQAQRRSSDRATAPSASSRAPGARPARRRSARRVRPAAEGRRMAAAHCAHRGTATRRERSKGEVADRQEPATARPRRPGRGRSTTSSEREDRPVVVGQGELDERQLVVPAQELAVARRGRNRSSGGAKCTQRSERRGPGRG